MGPRANFSCRTCKVTHEDLPVASTRCPVCGKKIGFKRLYDAINVSRSSGGSPEPSMRPGLSAKVSQMVQPILEHADRVRSGRERILQLQRQMPGLAQVPIHVPAPTPGIAPGAAGFLSPGVIPTEGRDASAGRIPGVIGGSQLIGRKNRGPTPIVVGNDPRTVT